MEMRRKDRQMNDEESLTLLKAGEYGILATVGNDGQPYGVPLNYVVLNNCIYYHGTNAGGTKYNNIINNHKVTFTVVGNTKVMPEKFGTLYESVIALGEAFEVTDEVQKRAALKEFLYKYSADFVAEGEKYVEAAASKTSIIKIEIKTLTGKHRV